MSIFQYIDTVIGCIDIILRLPVLRYIDMLVYCPNSSLHTIRENIVHMCEQRWPETRLPVYTVFPRIDTVAFIYFVGQFGAATIRGRRLYF